MVKLSMCAMIVCLLAATKLMAADQARRIVIYDGVATEVSAPAETSKDMWVTMKDLKRATKFVVKPQGVCRDQLCFPLPKARKAEFISKKGWFNLSEFARLVKQPFAVDEKHAVWHFGPRSDAQNAHLESLDAPDFALPDVNGKSHSLADYRGKKVLLLTWASW